MKGIETDGVYSYDPTTNELLFKLQPVCKFTTQEIIPLLNNQKTTIQKLKQDMKKIKHGA